MNVVNSGARYQIYGDEVRTFQNLPAMTYTIGFHPQMGFWLTKHVDLDAKEDRVYGRHNQRVDKIMRSYENADRNFGVILSGKKGIGKSLLARMIAEAAIKKDLPVIIVDTAISGISDFLSSIEQEAVIIFDEFEKVFARIDDHKDPQVELLSLFDGIDGGKKLFVITCNDPRKLNEFLINRPGRFHYHFEIKCPTGAEVRGYMLDKLGAGFESEIEKVEKLASMSDVTYDVLRAIAFDLRQGYSIEDTLEDLNINYERGVCFDITIRLSNGWQLTSYSQRIDLYSKENLCVDAYHGKDRFYLYFDPCDIEMLNGTLTIDPKKCKFRCNYDYLDDEIEDDDKASEARSKFNKEVKVSGVTFAKVSTTYVTKYADI